MKQCAETIVRALGFLAFSDHARGSRASIYIRVERIVAAILLSLATAIPAMAADMPAPGPAPIPPDSHYPVAAPLSYRTYLREIVRLDSL